MVIKNVGAGYKIIKIVISHGDIVVRHTFAASSLNYEISINLITHASRW